MTSPTVISRSLETLKVEVVDQFMAQTSKIAKNAERYSVERSKGSVAKSPLASSGHHSPVLPGIQVTPCRLHVSMTRPDRACPMCSVSIMTMSRSAVTSPTQSAVGELCFSASCKINLWA